MRMRSKEAQLERLKNIAESKNGTLLSTEFMTARTKYDFQCHAGHQFQLTSDKTISRGDWCPYCAGRYGDFQEKFRHIIEDLNGGTMLSKYVNYETKIKYSCSNGHVHYGDPRNLGAGKFCPDCKASHGEKAVAYYLQEKNYSYQTQYTFADCKGERNVLPFDFAVFDSDNLVCLIEYDGEQHFRPMRHSNREEENLRKFEETQRHDAIKNDYCKVHKIPLIRISCFDVDERRIKNLYRDVKAILDVELKAYANPVPSPE